MFLKIFVVLCETFLQHIAYSNGSKGGTGHGIHFAALVFDFACLLHFQYPVGGENDYADSLPD